MSPWRQKWQCGWFENWTENNLPSSETWARSDGIHKSRIAEPQTVLNRLTNHIPRTHTNVLTVFWVKIKFSAWKKTRSVSETREKAKRDERRYRGGELQKPKVRLAVDVRKNASQEEEINIHAVSAEIDEIILSSEQGDILLALHICAATSHKT